MKLRLTSRIVLIFVVFVGVLLAVVGVLSYRSGSQSLKAAAISEMLTEAIGKEAEVRIWMDHRFSDFGRLANDLDLTEKASFLVGAVPGSEEARLAHAALLRELTPFLSGRQARYLELFVIEPLGGKVVASTSPTEEGKSKIGHEYFDRGKDGLYLQAPYNSADLKAPAMTVAVPLRSTEGGVVAVLAARLNFAELIAIAQRRSGQHRTEDSFLVNTAGFMVTQPRLVREAMVLRRKIKTEAVRRCVAGGSGVILAPDYRGVPVISIYRWMTRQKLGVLVQMDQADALAPARTFGQFLALIGAMALLATAGLAFLVARTITRPLRALHDSVRNFAEGRLDEPLPESSDELGLLAREFNEMGTRHKRAEAERQVISEIVQSVITTTNLDELLQLAHRSIGNVLYAENCFVALYDPTTDLVHFEFWLDKFDPVPAPQPATGHTRTSYVLRTGRPLMLTEELKSRLFDKGQVEQSGSDSASWLGVPLRTPTRTIGVLAVQHYEEEGAYNQRDVEFLSTVGDQIAIAIERKQSEKALRDAEEKYRSIFEQSSEGIFQNTPEGRFVSANPALARMLGFDSPEELINEREDIKRQGYVDPALREKFKETLQKNGFIIGFEYEVYRRDGTKIWVAESSRIVRNAEGRALYYEGSVQEITARKRAEEKLLQAKEAAESNSRAKSEFLANMSHEIRTPMNGIIGMTELTLETELNRVQREYLGMVQSSAHSLLSLINDILDFSKIEAGHLTLESIDFSLRDCVGKTLETLEVRAQAKGLELAVRTDPQVSDTFVGDPARLRQVITNLVDNAIKFTTRGEIVVEIKCESRDATEACLHFSVCDRGTGIPKDKQAGIFEAFVQADGSTTRHYGGTGLGLGICTKIVEQMRGKIWVESTPGEGSTFHFTARFRLSQTPTRSIESRETVRGLRVLVVDDNATNRRIFHEMLLNWEMIPLLTTSAHEAMAEVERAADADWSFDLVLVDAMMPETDGFALARQLRNAGGTTSTPIIMLSSGLRPGDDALAQTAGVSTLLTKPVQQSVLLDAIQNAIERKAGHSPIIQATPETLPVRKPGARALRILIAEDNLINRAVAAGILEKQGHSLVHAENGREALRAFQDASFDLIFMDVQMPEMDGFEATRRIREMEQSNGHRTPIVAMTAHAMTGDRERCLAAGMDDYVSKPLRKEDILKILETVPKSVSSPAPASDGSASFQAAVPSGGKLEARLIFSREELLEQCDGDEELMEKLIVLFNENTPQILESIRLAIANHEAGALAASAHKLLSSLGPFGAAQARQLALSLEEQGRQADLDGAEGKFAQLEREIEEIYPGLADYSAVLV